MYWFLMKIFTHIPYIQWLHSRLISIGQFQKISIPNHGRLPCSIPPPLPSEIPKCVTPPCPQNSIIVNPPSPSDFHTYSIHTMTSLSINKYLIYLIITIGTDNVTDNVLQIHLWQSEVHYSISLINAFFIGYRFFIGWFSILILFMIMNSYGYKQIEN